MLTYELKISGDNDKYTKRFFEALGLKGSRENLTWPPPNAQKVEAKDFWGWRSSWSPSVEAYGGSVRVGKEWASLTLFFADVMQRRRGGFAVLYFHEYQKERVEYWEWIACDHTFTHRSTGNCQHLYTCTKCDDKYEVDSSG